MRRSAKPMGRVRAHGTLNALALVLACAAGALAQDPPPTLAIQRARGAITVDGDLSGEDSSPDFYWDAAGRVTPEGWTLELRIPFSSLRYSKADPQTWRIMLYRNYPRDFRTQMFSTTLPRGSNCFICRSNPLTGL